MNGSENQPARPATDTANTLDTQGGSFVGGDIHASGDVVLRDQWNIYHGLTPEQLDAALRKLVQSVRTADQPLTWNGREPYPGLNAFQETDSDLFFGRDVIVDEVSQRLRDAGFLCIAGPSGSGKSSLFQAGVIPQLRRAWAEAGQDCHVVRVTPGGEPLMALTSGLANLAADSARQAQQPNLAPDILRFQAAAEADPNALSHHLQTLSGIGNAHLVLFIDQFEEVFTQNNELRLGSVFIAQIARAAQAPGARIKIVLGMRSDFIAACAEHPQLNTLINQHFYQIGPMQPSELARAILDPASKVGVTVQPELAAQIIADMRNDPGALPLMQFALRNMFMTQGARKGEAVRLTQLAYREGGSVFDALNRHADAVLAGLTAEQQVIARDIFLRLVDVGQDGAPDTRRTEQLDELAQRVSGPSADAIGTVVQVLAGTRARLLSTGQQPNGQRTLALTHERLIQSWKWLHNLIEENREDIRLRNRLSADADEWEKKKRNEGLLYSGARLEDALASMKRMTWQLSALERDFVLHSTWRDSKFERGRYMAQARGGAVGGGLGFSCVMAIAFVATLVTNRLGSLSFPQVVALLVLLVLLTLPIGAFIGFLIGIGLWVSRKGHWALQIACAAALGGLAGGVALLLAGFALNPNINPGVAALAGVVLGASLGIGAAIAPSPLVRVLATLAGGALGMAVTAGLGVLFKDQMPLAVMCGLLLGGQLGLGVNRAAANRATLSQPQSNRLRIVRGLSARLQTRSQRSHNK